MQTIGDVIDAINRNTSGVHAAINATGDGIVLHDTANGSGTLSVAEGSSTTAHDLNLLAAATTVDGTQTINGSTTRTITLKSSDTLTDLQNDINNLGGGLSAGILTDGSSNPYRLSLTATQSGQAGNMIVDTSQIGGMSLQEMTHGQDALLALGNASASNSSAPTPRSWSARPPIPSPASCPAFRCKSTAPRGQPVSVTVGNDGTNIATSLQTLVTDYNSFRTQLTTDTAYNTTTETGAVLSDDGSALQLDEQLSQLLTSSFASSGPVQSLADVGITVQSDGTLSFNQSQFDSAWAANPTAVQQLFTAKTTGVSAQFDTLINQLAGQTGSLLSARIAALQKQISDNQSTITQMNQRLNDEQNLLYTQFYNMDLTIGKLKNTQSLISSDHPAHSQYRRYELEQQRLTCNESAEPARVATVTADDTEGTTNAIVNGAGPLSLHGSQDGHAAEAAVVAHRGGLAVGEPGPPVLAAGPRRSGHRRRWSTPRRSWAKCLPASITKSAGDLAKRVSAVYEFIFRSLVKAGSPPR